LALAGTVSPALAATCTVTPGSGAYPSIQAAINDVNCDPISVPAGTHTENLTIGRSLTLNGAGKTSTIIDGSGAINRVVTIDGSGIVVYINDLTVTGGDATSASPSATFGGGILVAGGATLRAENIQVEDNLASTGTNGRGGGLAIDTGSAYLTSTMFISNTANRRGGVLTGNAQGGGLYLNIGTLQMYGSQILSNTAAYRAGAGAGNFAAGGGLYVNQNAQVYLYSNTWQGNVARGSNGVACDFTCLDANGSEGGGAIGVFTSNSTAVLTITMDTFMSNIANDVSPGVDDNGGRGGAVSLNASTGRVTATLTAVTMKENMAARTGQGNNVDEEGRGGAIWARSTRLIVDRSTIYDNESALSGEGSGGGVYVREAKGDSDIKNSIIASNSAFGLGEGAQLYLNFTGAELNDAAKIAHVTLAEKGSTVNPHQALYYDGDSGNELLITNTIVTSHTTGLQNNGNPSEVTIDYILYYGNTANSTAGVPSPANQITGMDPKFVSPSGNNYHIRSDSPAIDVAPSGLSTDIDGDTRPQDTGFDIGADEFTLSKAYMPVILKNYP
jgi:hypothetical protein